MMIHWKQVNFSKKMSTVLYGSNTALCSGKFLLQELKAIFVSI